MTKIGEEINSLLDEITRGHEIGCKLDGDVSVEDFSRKTKLCLSQSAKILRDMVANGKLIRVRVRSESGFPMYVYRKAQFGYVVNRMYTN